MDKLNFNHFTVEETNLLGIYKTGGRRELTENISGALPFMDAEMRELAVRAMKKINALTESEYAALAVYPADEA